MINIYHEISKELFIRVKDDSWKELPGKECLDPIWFKIEVCIFNRMELSIANQVDVECENKTYLL